MGNEDDKTNRSCGSVILVAEFFGVPAFSRRCSRADYALRSGRCGGGTSGVRTTLTGMAGSDVETSEGRADAAFTAGSAGAVTRHEAQKEHPRSPEPSLNATRAPEVDSALPAADLGALKFDAAGAHSIPAALAPAVPAKSGVTASHAKHHTVTKAVSVRSVRRKAGGVISWLTAQT